MLLQLISVFSLYIVTLLVLCAPNRPVLILIWLIQWTAVIIGHWIIYLCSLKYFKGNLEEDIMKIYNKEIEFKFSDKVDRFNRKNLTKEFRKAYY